MEIVLARMIRSKNLEIFRIKINPPTGKVKNWITADMDWVLVK